MDAPGAVILRPMKREDVQALGRLAHEQGRNILPEDYARFLALEGARGHVLERDGVILGGITAMRYFEHAFLGPVLFAAGNDALGHAIALLAQSIEALQREGVDVIGSEAAATEEAILGRMGFETVRRTLVLERAPRAAPAALESVPMSVAHLLDVGSLDAAAVGYGRKQYLAALRDELPEGARVTVAHHDVTGYALLRRAARGYQLGPIVTRHDDLDAATILLRDTLQAANDAPVVLLAPEGTRLLPALHEQGFREVGALARMSAGTRATPTAPPDATEWVLGGRITG